VTTRRLSQAIAEGAGISLLLELEDGRSEAGSVPGAEGVVVRGAAVGRGVSELPVLAYTATPDEAAALGADAVVVAADTDDEELVTFADRAAELGLELVVRADDEDDVARVLESIDPEIFLLAAGPNGDDQEGPLERLLGLLPDVPAGKLAIAELSDATRADVEMLERAGIDAVVVSGNIDELSGESVPDV
jgi:hypothetical protein